MHTFCLCVNHTLLLGTGIACTRVARGDGGRTGGWGTGIACTSELHRFRIQSRFARDDQRFWTMSNQRFIQRSLESDWQMDRDLVTRKSV